MKIYPSNLNHIRFTKPTNEEIQQEYNFPCSITVLNQALSTAEVFYYDGEGNEFPQGRFDIPSDYLFQKALLKTDSAPTIKGLYPLLETGIYTNLGGINATTGKLNLASFDGTTWSLIAADLPQPIVNNYTNNNTYNLDTEQIVPSEALYTDDTLAGDILKRVDKETGKNVNYREVDTWYDGSVMNDSKVDGKMFVKKGEKYYKLINEPNKLALSVFGDVEKFIDYVNKDLSINEISFDMDLSENDFNSKIKIERDNIVLTGRIINENSNTLNPIITTKGNNITIKNIEIKAKNFNDFTASIRHFEGDNFVVENVVIDGGGIGIQIDGNSDISKVSIKNCVINDVISGIYIGKSSAEASGVIQDVLIQGCSITNGRGTDESNGGDGIKTVKKCSNITISNNYISDFVRDAIDLYASGDKVIVTDNHLLRSGVKAIDIKSNRSVYSPSIYGIDGENIIISNNIIQENIEGVSIDRSSTLISSFNKFICIDGNHFIQNKEAAIFLCSDLVTVRNNLFFLNGYDSNRSDYSVIRLGNDQAERPAKNNKIYGNTFVNNGKSSNTSNFALRSSNYCTENIFSNNIIIKRDDLENPYQGGVYVNSLSNLIVDGNYISVPSPYVVINGGDIRTSNYTSVTFDTIQTDNLILKNSGEKFISNILFVSDKDINHNLSDYISINVVKVSNGIETTVAYYSQSTLGVVKFQPIKMEFIEDSRRKLNNNDVLIIRAFKNGSPQDIKGIIQIEIV